MKILNVIISFFVLTLISCVGYANLSFHPITLPRDDAAHYKDVPYSVQPQFGV